MIADIAYIALAALVFFIVISSLIFFHELGHYSVGRFFGIKVERFSIGFGRPILKRTAKSGTEWTLSRIPLGGYVKFAGDAGAASNPDTEALEQIRAEQGDVSDIFHFRPVWQRALVVLAGPVANFILAAVLFGIALFWIGQRDTAAIVGEVEAGTPAAAAGLQPGDEIIRMDGKDISGWTAMSQYVMLRSGTPIDTVVLRDGREIDMTLEPRRVDDRDFVGGKMTRGQIGIRTRSNPEIIYTRYGPLEALGAGAGQVVDTITVTGHYIGRIFTGREDGKQLGSIGRIAAMTGKSTTDIARAEQPVGQKIKALLYRMLQLGAGISVALGFANLMPIPMLDGGHLVYYGYEAVARKPLSQRAQEMGFRFGMAVILALFVVLTINDIGYIGSIFTGSG